jgi:hypothetical protein
MPTLQRLQQLDYLMETDAQTDENGMDERRRLAEWSQPGRRATPAERGLIAQAILALGEIARCKRLLGVLRAGRARVAEIRFQEKLEDDVRYYEQMLGQDARTAVVGLKRTAMGVRFLIARWERLERLLAEEGTWLGADRIEAIQLQGYSGDVNWIYYSETAYQTWLDCLAAQADPKQRDIDLICATDVVPKAVQDRGRPLWAPDRAASQARLKALVERELPPLRELEAKLRIEYEEPTRAAANDLAQARFPNEEAALLRAIRSHEGAYKQAVLALDRLARSSGAAARGSRARTRTSEPLEAPANLVSPPPLDGPEAVGQNEAGVPQAEKAAGTGIPDVGAVPGRREGARCEWHVPFSVTLRAKRCRAPDLAAP